MESLIVSFQEVLKEIKSRFDVEQYNGAPMQAVVRRWEEAPKPADLDLFNAAVKARKELQNLAVRFSEDDVERWAVSTGLCKLDLFDAIGASFAVAYHKHQSDFFFCDWLVNNLVNHVYNGFVSGNEKWPNLFYDVYLAFDAGEYFRPGEEELDAGEVYTRPLIGEIMKREATKKILANFGLS